MSASTEKTTAQMIEGLRHALLSGAEEHRLFRSGKLDGLFRSRIGLAGEAAKRALREGYLQTVRTEQRGNIITEWVRITPAGVEFLYQQDSPRAVLAEMQQLLQDAKHGAPAWLDGLLSELKNLADRFGEEMQRYLQRLDMLSRRVEEAVRRGEAGVPPLSDPMQAIIPWGLDALHYLDQRQQTCNGEACPFPELFGAVHQRHQGLSIPSFHDGLRRLADNRAVQLVPFGGNVESLPQPEYALIDGSRVLYYAKR